MHLCQKTFENHCYRIYTWLGCRIHGCSTVVIPRCVPRWLCQFIPPHFHQQFSFIHVSTDTCRCQTFIFCQSVVVLICPYLIWVGLFPFFSADLNNIKFSAYRTAMKLRRVQKALRCKSPSALPLRPSSLSYSSSFVGCFPLSPHLDQGCCWAWWELSKGWDMLAVETCSFRGPSILSKLQTCFQINPQLSSSLSLLSYPTWKTGQLFYGRKHPSQWFGATGSLCFFAILGLLDAAAELLKQIPVVRGQHDCS